MLRGGSGAARGGVRGRRGRGVVQREEAGGEARARGAGAWRGLGAGEAQLGRSGAGRGGSLRCRGGSGEGGEGDPATGVARRT